MCQKNWFCLLIVILLGAVVVNVITVYTNCGSWNNEDGKS